MSVNGIKKITETEIKKCSVKDNMPDRPSSSGVYGCARMSPSDVKAAFDKLPRLIIDYYNALADAVQKISDDISLSDSQALRLHTGIEPEHTLKDLFGDITDGNFSGYLTLDENTTLIDFYESQVASATKTGTVPPDNSVEGKVGNIYIVIQDSLSSPELYVCVSASDGAYSWVKFSDITIEDIKTGIGTVTEESDGLMKSEDKKKLDSIWQRTENAVSLEDGILTDSSGIIYVVSENSESENGTEYYASMCLCPTDIDKVYIPELIHYEENGTDRYYAVNEIQMKIPQGFSKPAGVSEYMPYKATVYVPCTVRKIYKNGNGFYDCNCDIIIDNYPGSIEGADWDNIYADDDEASVTWLRQPLRLAESGVPGCVMPEMKDATMTVPVGVDSAGKLWTEKQFDESGVYTGLSAGKDSQGNVISSTYAPLSETANKIGMEFDDSSFMLKASLATLDDKQLSLSQVELPIGDLVTGGSYDTATSEIVLSKLDGGTSRFSVSSIKSDMVNQDEFNETCNQINESLNEKYVLPETGIPAQDLSQDVNSLLNKATKVIANNSQEAQNTLVSLTVDDVDYKLPGSAITVVETLPDVSSDEYEKHLLYLCDEELSFIVSRNASFNVVQQMPQEMQRCSLVRADNILYVIGGFNGNDLDTILKYNLDTNELSTLNVTLPEGMSAAASIVRGEYIYIFGGSGQVYSDKIYKLNTEAQSISTLEKTLPRGMQDFAHAVVGNTAYFFGGNITGGTTNYIVKFDFDTETVTQLDVTMPAARMGAAAFAFGTDIYVFGGSESATKQGYRTILKFDTTTETITTIEEKLPTAVFDFCSGVIGNHVYIVGGLITNSSFTKVIQRFDVAAQKAETVSFTLPFPIAMGPGISYGDSIFLVGGRKIDPSTGTQYSDEICKIMFDKVFYKKLSSTEQET